LPDDPRDFADPSDYWTKERVAALRRQSGMSVRDFADYLHVSPSTVTSWMNGKHPPYRYRTLRALHQLADRLAMPGDQI
jgi:transcriptional regulator with XRE-family HTH domain